MNFVRYLRNFLLSQLRALREILLEMRLISVLVILVVIGFILVFQPIPPNKVVIAAGMKGKPSHAIAMSLAEQLNKYGVNVELRHSEGSVESAALLQDPKSGVDVALIVGGALQPDQAASFYSLGSVAYSPLWVFCNKSLPKNPLSIPMIDELNLRVGLGPEGGATYPLAVNIFDINGIDIRQNKNYRKGSYQKDVEDLLAKNLDCIIINATYFDASIQKLLMTSGISLMSIDNALAYQLSIPYLSKVTIPVAAVNIKDGIPKNEIDLIASTMSLVVKKDLNPDIQNLLLTVAKETLLTSKYRFFAKAGQFPVYMDTTIPISPVAYHFYSNGPVRMIPYMPYWVGGFISRVWVWILAFAALIYPASKVISQLIGIRQRLRRFNIEC